MKGLVAPKTRAYVHLEGLQIVSQVKDLQYIYIHQIIILYT